MSDQEALARTMCHKHLSVRELKDICLYRKFPNPPGKDKESLADFVAPRLLSPDGLREAMQSLDDLGKIILFVLSFVTEEPSIEDLQPYVQSALQEGNRYIDAKSAFGILQTQLINRGLVLLRDETVASSRDSRYARLKLQRIHKDEIGLPPFPVRIEAISTKPDGTILDNFMKQALDFALLKKSAVASISPGSRLFNWLCAHLSIDNAGRICLCTTPVVDADWLANKIYAHYLRVHGEEMKAERWQPDQTCIWTSHLLFTTEAGKGLTLSSLLSALTKLGCDPQPGKLSLFREFLDEGVRTGFLYASGRGENTVFGGIRPQMLATDFSPPLLSMEACSGGVKLNVLESDLNSLFVLSQISRAHSTSGSLFLAPDIVRIGKSYATDARQPVWNDVRAISKDYARAFETVESRHGKLILHENISLLRIEDLGLRALIKQKFSDQIREIEDPYMALAQELKPELEAFIRKQGYSVRYKA
jgi:hypothetical protein